ncbi:MAG: cation:dicarboxylate symporter family transporter, partial [Planctomycetota bacterium]
MAGAPDQPTDDEARARKNSGLSRRIVLALVGGIACGVFLGEICAPLQVIGDIYIGLMQMTVLPYIILALVASIGRLSFRQSKALFSRGLVFLLLLWGIGLVAIAVSGLAYPPLETASFFSTNVLEAPPRPDLVALFVPVNVFNSIVNNAVPAVVVFCIFLGVALMGVPNKEKTLDVLDVLTAGIARVTGYVARLTPIGVFSMIAAAAGTMTVEELGRTQGYLLSYTLLVGVLTFWVLPSLIAALTPFTYRD